MANSTSSKPRGHDYNCLTINELQALASERMIKQARDYYNEGSDSNSTLKENIDAYQKYRIRPRVLRDVSHINTETEVFGFKNAFPCAVAPTAMQCLAHADGEIATANACKNMNVAMGLSSFATKTLEEVAEASGSNPRVLQLYLFEERDHSVRLIKRAKAAGYKAVFLTVDTPMLGRRNAEIRNQFKLPKPYKIANFDGTLENDQLTFVMNQTSESAPQVSDSNNAEPTTGYTDGGKRVLPSGKITFHTHAANPTLSWERDMPFLKEQCGPEMEVWIKGVATAEDTELAIKHGVDGIVVSNHGGRQLNGALATLDALPEVVAAARGRIPIHVDGGIRHGKFYLLLCLLFMLIPG